MTTDDIDARERRRAMILNSLNGASAQKNYKRKKKCIAYVKPLPEERERPPKIQFETKRAEKFKIACSPVTFRTTSLPRILRERLDVRGISNKTSDSVGQLTRSSFNSSIIIDVFEQQHMDKIQF